MIEILPNLPCDLVGIRASGSVTAADYESVLIPTIEKALKLPPPEPRPGTLVQAVLDGIVPVRA